MFQIQVADAMQAQLETFASSNVKHSISHPAYHDAVLRAWSAMPRYPELCSDDERCARPVAVR